MQCPYKLEPKNYPMQNKLIKYEQQREFALRLKAIRRVIRRLESMKAGYSRQAKINPNWQYEEREVANLIMLIDSERVKTENKIN